MAFMGSCFAGAMAISHAFFNRKLSMSSVEGGLRPPSVLSFEDPPFCLGLVSPARRSFRVSYRPFLRVR